MREREKPGDWKVTSEDAGLTWQRLLDDGVHMLTGAGIAEADLDAWYLFEKAFQIDRVHFLLDRGRLIPENRLEKEAPLYGEYLKKRASRIPLQQILGTQEFMGLTFYVNEHVLIPRQDTETLVEEVLKNHNSRELSILDMCTGSGCIAISLAILGEYGRVKAVDISKEALKVAEKNGAGLNNLTFLESDMFLQLDSLEKYDVIVSNPPYIPSDIIKELQPEVRLYEPRTALDGAADGLHFYRILAKKSMAYLRNGGSVYFEIGYDQAEAVTSLLAENGYTNICVLKDGPGLDRVVTGVWYRKQEVKDV